MPSFHDYFGEVADKIAPLIEADGRHLVLERTSASPENEMEAVSVARLQLYDGVLLSVAGLDPRPAEPRADVQADRAARRA